MQRHVNLVDLVKSFPTNIYLQILASIQKRTSPIKFAHMAEKSEKSSISNLSTKVLSCLGNRRGEPKVVAEGTALLLKAMKRHQVPRLAFISSMGVGDSFDQCLKMSWVFTKELSEY